VARSFADRLIQRTRALGHPLCAGLDPHLGLLPPLFRHGAMRPGAPETAEVVERFCLAALDRFAGRVAVVKPQVAFFESLGWPGLRTLARVLEAAHQRDLLVVLDAKRGDIGSTAGAYAAAYLGAEAPLRVDAVTLNVYMGGDSLEPWVKAAEAADAGLFVLVRTSNPGAADLQDLPVDGIPLFERVAGLLAPFAGRLAGGETGWSSLGAVLGATWPDQAHAVRERLPRSLFLVPGYGAQGAAAAEALAGFVPGPGGRLEGGLVSSSRGLLFPPGSDTEDASAWERAIDQALDRAAGELGEALG